ncbi:MAG: hypothetical protein WCK89_08410 [bacterium]
MSEYVTKDQCATQSAAVLEKLESIERQLFVDNGHTSIQTRLERHDLVIRALLWVVSVVMGTVIAGCVSACVVLVKLMAKA